MHSLPCFSFCFLTLQVWLPPPLSNLDVSLKFSKTENIVPFCDEIEITMDVTNNFGTDEWVDLAIFYNFSLIVLEPGDFTENPTPPNGFNSY